VPLRLLEDALLDRGNPVDCPLLHLRRIRHWWSPSSAY
jgi:hypothetical protein